MIDSFIRYVKFEKRYSDHTITAYEKDLLQLEAFAKDDLEKDTIQVLTFKDVRAWIFFLSENDYTNKSINRKIATAKSYYKFLLSREVISSNPTDRIQPLKTEKKLPVFLKEAEIIDLLDKVVFDEASEFDASRNKVIFELLYGTGIRLAELTGLKLKDVSFYSNSIKVLGKRNKERLIPLNANLVNTIKEYLDQRMLLININDDQLLLTSSGNKIYPMLVQRVIKKYITKVSSISKKSPHVLRHTFATHLLNKGADLNSVKDLLGHSSLAATQVYTHNTMSKLKAVFDQAHPKA